MVEKRTARATGVNQRPYLLFILNNTKVKVTTYAACKLGKAAKRSDSTLLLSEWYVPETPLFPDNMFWAIPAYQGGAEGIKRKKRKAMYVHMLMLVTYKLKKLLFPAQKTNAKIITRGI